jgi:hypothetical protein
MAMQRHTGCHLTPIPDRDKLADDKTERAITPKPPETPAGPDEPPRD